MDRRPIIERIGVAGNPIRAKILYRGSSGGGLGVTTSFPVARSARPTRPGEPQPRPLTEDWWASLSTVQQFCHNLTPSRSPVTAEERPGVDELITTARAMDKERQDGQPVCLLGFVGVKMHGAGTVRNQGCFALVSWALPADAVVWYPVVYVSAITTSEPLLLDPPPPSSDRSVEAAAWISMIYSAGYRDHLATLKQAALARDARLAA